LRQTYRKRGKQQRQRAAETAHSSEAVQGTWRTYAQPGELGRARTTCRERQGKTKRGSAEAGGRVGKSPHLKKLRRKPHPGKEIIEEDREVRSGALPHRGYATSSVFKA